MTKPAQLNDNNGNILRLKILQQGQPFLTTLILARVLTALNSALESFLLAELLGNHSHPKPALKKEIGRFVAGTQLLLVDVNLEHFIFTFELAPTEQGPAFHLLKNIAGLSQQLFALFIEAIFTNQLFSEVHVNLLCKKYPAKERIQIFKPIYDHLINPGQKYQVLFAVEKEGLFQTWPFPEDMEIWSVLIPEVVKNKGEQGESYYQYLKTGEVNDLFGKRSKYEKVLIKEDIRHDVYPYQIQKISIKGKTYRFSHTLTAAVTVKDGQYRIALPELQLSVSHSGRAGAEKEFDSALARIVSQLEKADSSMDAKTRSAIAKLKELLS